MEENLEELISTKSWADLTAEEKKFVVDCHITEEKYAALQRMFLSIDEMPKSTIAPDPGIIRDLQRRVSRKTSNPFNRILEFRMPGMAAFILIAAAAITGWLSRPVQQVFTSVPVEKLIVRTDTVYLKQQPDTVFRNRIVYRYIKQDPEPVPIVANAGTENDGARSVSMKEKTELENLLVTGSE